MRNEQVKPDKSHSHVPAPITVGPSAAPEHSRDKHDHASDKPPASIVEDKRWEMPCTD